ncbi:MAG: bifunctional phosphoribosylaminoimidazolecarboxamide formyltransferase/IMP cyclohydrolase [Candidatus Eisenbacteria bacterium]|nr:bifunctional phosphoribosylaminoimidazolecarboxamide formyltransferase/IMP cyclohydrolase [Candidatus Eisenbacteria bacterium]
MKRIARAILSVSDKEGIVELGRALAAGGTTILSTGGTARRLREEGVPVREVGEATGFPEMLGGRVRTLHPIIFGGILGRRSREGDRREMEKHGIEPIDLVVVNFYPFRETAATPGATEEEIVESIDIGGPSLLRAAAKSFEDVAVLHRPDQYVPFLERLASPEGADLAYRRELAAAAFRHVEEYDAAIRDWFDEGGEGEEHPRRFRLEGTLRRALRYGENPHQSAAWYDRSGSTDRFRVLQGKELSYNNLLDADAALRLVREFDGPAAVVVKHGNPCGAAALADPREAFLAAYAGDPQSAFGGIVALNRPVDGLLASEMKPHFLEVIAAPGFDDEALDLLGKKKNLRLLLVEGAGAGARPPEIRVLADGFLTMDPDPIGPSGERWRVATERAPTEAEALDLRFAWKVVKHVRSNAILLARKGRTLGVGAGQMSRVDAAELAVTKARGAGHETAGAVLASDGFFPFPDGVERAAEAGIVALIQPGGSIRDAEVIAEADRRGLAMVLTGVRHFRH